MKGPKEKQAVAVENTKKRNEHFGKIFSDHWETLRQTVYDTADLSIVTADVILNYAVSLIPEFTRDYPSDQTFLDRVVHEIERLSHLMVVYEPQYFSMKEELYSVVTSNFDPVPPDTPVKSVKTTLGDTETVLNRVHERLPYLCDDAPEDEEFKTRIVQESQHLAVLFQEAVDIFVSKGLILDALHKSVPRHWRRILDDLYMKSMGECIRALPAFKGECKLSSYFYGIAYRIGVSYTRDRNRHERLHLDNWEKISFYIPTIDKAEAVEHGLMLETDSDRVTKSKPDGYEVNLEKEVEIKPSVTRQRLERMGIDREYFQ